MCSELPFFGCIARPQVIGISRSCKMSWNEIEVSESTIWLFNKIVPHNDIIYLSIVIATIFHVDAVNIPHKRNLLFHNRHSNVPRIPSLCITFIFPTVSVVNNSITEAIKSRKLYKTKLYFWSQCCLLLSVDSKLNKEVKMDSCETIVSVMSLSSNLSKSHSEAM